jgi:hypothetical protein
VVKGAETDALSPAHCGGKSQKGGVRARARCWWGARTALQRRHRLRERVAELGGACDELHVLVALALAPVVLYV